MKDIIKRQLAFIVMIVMLFSMLPTSFISAFADEAESAEEETYVSAPVQAGGSIQSGGEAVSPMGAPTGFTVTFMAKNAAGTYGEYEVQQVAAGGTPVLPKNNPQDTRTQVFTQWDANATKVVNGDMDIYAEYVDRDTVLYAVEFYYEDGTSTGGKTVYTALLAGNDISGTVPVPEVKGYTPEAAGAVAGFTLKKNGNDYEVAISDTKVSESKTFRVVYIANGNTKFTVKHWQQKVGVADTQNATNYVLVDTVVSAGPTGSQAKAEAKVYDGFTLASDPDNTGVSIEADEDSVVNLYYTRNYYAVYFDLGGGTLPNTATNPMSVQYGADTKLGTITPSRQGYGNGSPVWSLQDGGAVPTVMPTKDVIVKANWTPKTASYKVALWAQNADDNNYTLAGTVDVTGATVESTISTTTGPTIPSGTAYNELRKYYDYDAGKTGETTYKVAGDGSTVVDAYYSRKTYKITFDISSSALTMTLYKLSDGSIVSIKPDSGTPYTEVKYTSSTSPKYSFTARYNENVASRWPTADNFTTSSTTKFTGWNGNWASRRITMTSEMCVDGGLTISTATTTSTVYYQYLQYMIESPDTTSPVSSSRTKYGSTFYDRDENISQYLYNNSSSWSAKDLGGLTQNPTDGQAVTSSNAYSSIYKGSNNGTTINYNFAFFYTRNSYYLIYNNGSDTAVEKGPVKYGFSINNTNYNYTPATPKNLENMGYTFGGWYTDRSFAENARFDFTKGMTPYTLVLYAKWVAPTYTVTFDTNGGSANPPSQTVPAGGTITVPADPTNGKLTFDGWYQEVNGSTVRFLDTQEIYKNTTLVARWIGDDSVTVTVKYQLANGTRVAPDETVTGRLGETLTIPAKVIADLMPTEREKKQLLSNSDGHTIIFVYNNSVQLTYEVHYTNANTNASVASSKTVTFSPAEQSMALATEQRKLVPGYTADAYEKTLILINPGVNVIEFFYTEDTVGNGYTVKHYFEKADSIGYDIETDPHISAHEGATVSAEKDIKTRTGFVYDASLSSPTGVVRNASGEEGELVLELYYRRTRHSYDVQFISLQLGELDSYTRQQIKYGQEVTESAESFSMNQYVGYKVNGQTGNTADAKTTITGDSTVFIFEYNTMYTVNATAVNGSITPATASVAHGSKAEFTYTPDTYYELDKILLNGTEVTPAIDAGKYTVANVTANATLEVRFRKTQFPLTITAKQQDYVYNTAPQGYFAADVTDTKYVEVTGLKAGHTLAGVTLTGNQQTNAGTYTGAIVPTTFKVVDGSGADATGFYTNESLITRNNGTLYIAKKGDGTDPSGNQKPIVITAADQSYSYNGQLQGEVGLQTIGDVNPLASATGLIGSHKLTQVTINGDQKKDVGDYTGELKPTKAVIMDGSTTVTDNYLIETSSYVAGTLHISRYGDGNVIITAQDQVYTYNGAAQGKFGANIAISDDTYVKASGLFTGHVIQSVTLTDVSTAAQNLTDAGPYAGVIQPSSVVIIDTNDGNKVVTGNYNLTYVNGDLNINPKGNGKPDPTDPSGKTELPLDIYALLQTAIYDGTAKGTFGEKQVGVDTTLVNAAGLVGTQKLYVTLSADAVQGQAIDAGTYPNYVVPGSARIIDTSLPAAQQDVTANYRIEASSYHSANLIVNPKGNGKTDPSDPNGGEYPLDVTAIRQNYIYSGLPQGTIGLQTTRAKAEAVLTAATMAQLVSGHHIEQVTINTKNNEGQKTDPGTYTDYLIPAGVKIYAGSTDVTKNYNIKDSGYHAGILFIDTKGSDGDNDKVITVTASAQTFVFNNAPQGVVGKNLDVQNIDMTGISAEPQVVTSPDLNLAAGHYIKYVDIDVAKQTTVATYANYLKPTNVKIYAMVGNVETEVTSFYKIDSTSYKPGTLTITKYADSGVKIIVRDQKYVYNGTAQGEVGAKTLAWETQAGRDAALAYAEGLHTGHFLKSLTIGGTQQINAGTYDILVPSNITIVDASGADMTGNYDLDTITYVKGNLIINPKGNGTPDPSDPNGGEYPLEISALPQSFVYDGTAKGNFGEKQVGMDTTLVEATGVLGTQTLYATLSADTTQGQAIDAGTYPNYIVPGSARIIDASLPAAQQDVTTNYFIKDSSYHAANLVITPKGNGTPDPSDPNGGEYPLDVTALRQNYIYSGLAQGNIGAKTTQSDAEAVLTAATMAQLVPGHHIEQVTINTKNNEGQKTDPGTYTDYLIPAGVKIYAGQTDVTKNYRIDNSSSYHAGILFIDKKGLDPEHNDQPITVTARAQNFVFTNAPQGIVGKNMDVPGLGGTPVVSSTNLAANQYIKYVDIDVAQQTATGIYTDYLTPTNVKIYTMINGTETDVTSFYKLDGTSYKPGTLTIDAYANANVKVIVRNQVYTYDSLAHGVVGQQTLSWNSSAGRDAAVAYADGLYEGHYLATLFIGGTQETNAKDYVGHLTSSKQGVTIVDEQGNDVTANYDLDAITYVPGDLIINPKGNGKTDPSDPNDGELPLDIFALVQEYIYDGTAKGDFGEKQVGLPINATLVKAEGVLATQTLYVTLSADATQGQAIDANTYTDYIVPGSARIIDTSLPAGSQDVTANYRIEESSYKLANLIVHKKGSGPDPSGNGELPLRITAQVQTYDYDGTLKGNIGVKTGTKTVQTAIAAVIKDPVTLVSGHYVSSINIKTDGNGGQQKDAATYGAYLIPDDVTILDADGANVTKNYNIVAGSTYIPANLVINKRGAPSGGPITITAADQTYIYSGAAQGIVGTNLDVATKLYNGNPIVSAAAGHLANGHVLKTIDIDVPQKTEADIYNNHLVPSKVVIVDTNELVNGAPRDVTAFYDIDLVKSYVAGKLEIEKKGSGDNNDKPIIVTAKTQEYTYDGTAKGKFGAVTDAEVSTYVTVEGLNAGHTAFQVTLNDVSTPAQNLIDAATYSNIILPSAIVIKDGAGNTISNSNYNIDLTALTGTYRAGDLVIKARGKDGGSDTPITISAIEQRYVYTDTPQGIVGANLDIVTNGTTLAQTLDLLPDHRLVKVDIGGSQQIYPKTYTGELVPSNVVIWDSANQVVPITNYLITAASYVPADLVIDKKGSGTDNKDPLQITAEEQQYNYDGGVKGAYGPNMLTGDYDFALVSVPDLLPGHYAYSVTLKANGVPQSNPDTYPNYFTPSALVIRKGDPDHPSTSDPIMTEYYNITTASYHDGNLVITPKDGADLIVTALDQDFVYDGTPKGTLTLQTGKAASAAVVAVQGLYTGHYVDEVKISLTNDTMDHTEPATHTGVLNAGNLLIRNATGNDVTYYYNLAGATYEKGTLTIHKKGDGTPDNNGGENPLTITANAQTFTYNAQAQGYLNSLTIDVDNAAVYGANNILAEVEKGLLNGHTLKSITLLVNGSATGETDAGTYTIVPTKAVIVDGSGTEVQDKYNIVPTSYVDGSLIIEKKELTVAALQQDYVYSGNLQGVIGTLTPTSTSKFVAPKTFLDYVSVTGLVNGAGHSLASVNIIGAQETEPGDNYPLGASDAQIINASLPVGSQDVTKNYKITHTGNVMIIHKKGDGTPDNNGGENPLKIAALPQSYIYNDTPQGEVGNGIDASGLVTATGLLTGHSVHLVDIPVAKKTDAGTYTNYLTPANIKIKDGGGADVTKYYLIDEYTTAQRTAGSLQPNNTYSPATLTIEKKGNGTPDGNGGELPFEVTAKRQTYIYNDALQGAVGDLTTAQQLTNYIDASAVLTSAGHYIKVVHLDVNGQRIYPNLNPVTGAAIDYDDILVPESIKIVKLVGGKEVDVTANYKIEASSFISGNLFIDKKGGTGGNTSNITVTAIDQTYGYDGALHGIVGYLADVTTAANKYDGNIVVTTDGLLTNHKVLSVTIGGSQQSLAGDYDDTLVPSAVTIVDGKGNDVTKYYKIDASASPNQTYKAGSLFITKAGGNVRIKLLDQPSYIYNGNAQGVVGDIPVTAVGSPYVEFSGLNPGDRLARITIDQTQQTDPGNYPLTVAKDGSGVYILVIEDSLGNDVTANYDVANFKVTDATMSIAKRKVTIEVQPQSYVYNDSLQGVAGGQYQVDAGLYTTVLAEATSANDGLATGHTLTHITLGGNQLQYVGSVDLPATNAVISDGSVDVRQHYDITFVKSKLTITQLSDNGSFITITALEQRYPYNSNPQGVVGKVYDPQPAGIAQVDNNVLLTGHTLYFVNIAGKQQTAKGDYLKTLIPSGAIIHDAAGKDVTANYMLDKATTGNKTYIAGDLIIEASATPIELVAREQVYVYNGQLQGSVGVITIAANDTNPLVRANNLLTGHRLQKVTLGGSQRINAATYPGELVPSDVGVVIVDSKGTDVTANYAFTATHISANLVINKKGNGTPDGNGGENPMIVQALKQNFVYNELAQGDFGSLPYTAALAKITGLVSGHSVRTIDLQGNQQVLPAIYGDEVQPVSIEIVDKLGNPVTTNYYLEPVGQPNSSYLPADLEIHKKGNGKPDGNGGELPLEITTPDQVFVYDTLPHGNFGVQIPVTAANPVASALELVTGHSIEYITLSGTQQVNAGRYTKSIIPSGIKIVDAGGNNVTDYYLIKTTSYIPGNLIIRQRGINGDPDVPLVVTVFDQTYMYDGLPQGTSGQVAPPTAVASLVGQMPIHTFAAVTIDETGKQVHAGVYYGALKPLGVRIVDAQGNDVTANYYFTPASYVAGTLTILKRGRMADDGTILPILIGALDQSYFFNGRRQGIIGPNLQATTGRIPLVEAQGLADGDYVDRITLRGKQQVAVGIYPDTFMPSNAKIRNSFGNDVTGDYLITEDGTYWAGALIILESEEVLGVFDLENAYFGITSRDVGDLVE